MSKKESKTDELSKSTTIHSEKASKAGNKSEAVKASKDVKAVKKAGFDKGKNDARSTEDVKMEDKNKMSKIKPKRRKSKSAEYKLPVRLRDQNGDMIPVKYIPEHDLKRHVMIEEILLAGQDLERQLSEYKSKVVRLTDEFIANMLANNDLDAKTFKGNLSLYNFDKSKLVEINTLEFISFNEKISMARELINDCLEDWVKGSKRELSLLVSKAFKTDKRGFLDTKRILDLLSYDIEDDKWQQAMDIIKESITVNKRKQYFSFKVRNDRGVLDRVRLSFSDVDYEK